MNVYADETISEKATATANDIKRGANETVNRIEEATCTGSEAECIRKRIENRLEETKDSIQDKSSETINKIN